MFFAVVTLLAVILVRLAWVLVHSKRKVGTRIGIAFCAIFGALLLAGGTRRHLDRDGSYRRGGKFGPQAWYQDVGSGGLLLIASLAASVALEKNNEKSA